MANLDGEKLRRFSIVVIPPERLCNELRACLDAFTASRREANLFPFFDPHVTLLYAPSASIPSTGVQDFEGELRQFLPTMVSYGPAVASAYGTVRLVVRPQAALQRLHAALLARLRPAALTRDADSLLKYFNTTNVGVRYRPYLTIARFRTVELAESFRLYLEGLALPDQTIDQVWFADASHPPLRLLRRMGGNAAQTKTK